MAGRSRHTIELDDGILYWTTVAIDHMTRYMHCPIARDKPTDAATQQECDARDRYGDDEEE